MLLLTQSVFFFIKNVFFQVYLVTALADFFTWFEFKQGKNNNRKTNISAVGQKCIIIKTIQHLRIKTNFRF